MNLSELDPRTLLMITASLSTAAMLTGNIQVLVVIMLLCLVTLLLGGVSLYYEISKLKGIYSLILSLFIIQCFFNRTGEVLVSLYGYDVVFSGGFNIACLLCIRFVIIVLSASIILQGKPRDYLLAFTQLGMPYDLAFSVMAGFRFLPLLREEALNVFYSIQLRGCELKKISPVKKFSLYGKICLPILINTLKKCRDISVAVEARGFRAYQQRTCMRRLQLSRYDVIVMIAYPIITLAAYCFPLVA